MTKRVKAPKVLCPQSGRIGTRWGGGLDQCEHCGTMVYHAARDGRVSKHYLPAAMVRCGATKLAD